MQMSQGPHAKILHGSAAITILYLVCSIANGSEYPEKISSNFKATVKRIEVTAVVLPKSLSSLRELFTLQCC
jgi:hypothetical protein